MISINGVWELEIGGDESVAVCECCRTRQMVPRLDDEKRANLCK